MLDQRRGKKGEAGGAKSRMRHACPVRAGVAMGGGLRPLTIMQGMGRSLRHHHAFGPRGRKPVMEAGGEHDEKGDDAHEISLARVAGEAKAARSRPHTAMTRCTT